MSKQKNITSLQIGEKAIVAQFSDARMASKLMAMGLLPGGEIGLIRRAPFNGAFYIKSFNHTIALRKEEAENVLLTNLEFSQK